MSYEKFIQSRTIARKVDITPASGYAKFPSYTLDSFIEFETDGYLIGANWMTAHNLSVTGGNHLVVGEPFGFLLAKVSGLQLSIPAGGDITNFSGAQILASHLDYPSDDGANHQPDGRQTTLAYDANSKRIVLKSNDRLGVYVCQNLDLTKNGTISFGYTLTAYFVRS